MSPSIDPNRELRETVERMHTQYVRTEALLGEQIKILKDALAIARWRQLIMQAAHRQVTSALARLVEKPPEKAP